MPLRALIPMQKLRREKTIVSAVELLGGKNGSKMARFPDAKKARV